jgi:hypothetical protein
MAPETPPCWERCTALVSAALRYLDFCSHCDCVYSLSGTRSVPQVLAMPAMFRSQSNAIPASGGTLGATTCYALFLIGQHAYVMTFFTSICCTIMRIGLRHTNLVSAVCLVWQAMIADCELWPSASSKECFDTYAGIASLLDSQLKHRR